MASDSVKGVFCADEAGLSVCNRGTLDSASIAGDVTNEMMKLANNLEPDLPISSIVVQLLGSFFSFPEIAYEVPSLLTLPISLLHPY
ncbi:unnamed protein product [Gongylonema pulchrum]|uniref:Protein-serine/threonine phosphatase n=1 Tax=Gongylonema pulchrum TaxID=637853 RepID=A0A183DNJ0_9BILA|nr:unnamed protein product [Gongylonema pulchrum]